MSGPVPTVVLGVPYHEKDGNGTILIPAAAHTPSKGSVLLNGAPFTPAPTGNQL